ncbi:hypothetical protein SteCoe_11657 [Stentor coeruleus]|uniref:Uncharacterized protein n=1 Tax=Stentor coeruleus TaxID=5963 RepID=A0A1R2CCW0_9CILI|nr:hypothetical protein SteCoe_11657 [Stentor coeruleus]
MYYQEFIAEEPVKRISDASTIDMECDSNDDTKTCFSEVLLTHPTQCMHLMIDISDEQKFLYSKLQTKLVDVYTSLEREIEPVCIRDLCYVAPKPVGLCSISNSCITRRRVMALKQC